MPVDFKQKNSQRNNFNIVVPNTGCVSQIVLNIPNDFGCFCSLFKIVIIKVEHLSTELRSFIIKDGEHLRLQQMCFCSQKHSKSVGV